WGNNFNGQLGDGTAASQRTVPTQVGTGTDWVSASAGYNHTVAVRADGTLWAWGDNGAGELGDNAATLRYAPGQVGTGTNWVSAEAGGYHAVGEQACRTVWAWGSNVNGELGDGTNVNKSSPVQVYTPSALLGFSPASAPPGTSVAVTGRGLLGLTAL